MSSQTMLAANSSYLDTLKRNAVESNRKFENKVWMVSAIVIALVSVYFTKDLYMKMGVVLATLALVIALQFSETTRSSTQNATARASFRRDVGVQPVQKTPIDDNRKASTRQAELNAAVASEILSPTKNRQARADASKSANWGENFDPQSPQRLTQAVCADGPTSQPTYTSTAPSLYASTNNTYVGKSNMANLGYQFTGRGNSIRSPASRSSHNNYNNNNNGYSSNTPSSVRFQAEPSPPVWHNYHNSPTNVDIGSSPAGSHRKGTLTLSTGSEEDEFDPYREIVNRVTAEQKGVEVLGSPSFSSTPSRAQRFSRTGGITPGTNSRTGLGGLTEDRMEYVLSKYLESQEQILMDTTADIVQQLTMRAAGGGSGAGSAVLLQSQDDVSRVQALLQLQSDRQVLQSNKAVTLQDLLSYCRSVGISEELLKRYEAAAAVLLSPNRGALSGSHIGSGVGGCNSSSCATSSSFFSPSASLQRSSSGGFPSSSLNSTSTRTTAASFGKGWMSPAPVVEPFASSSSSVMGAGAATFSSSRRGRRY